MGPAGTESDNMDYAYNLEYLSFCQPVGPRLGKLRAKPRSFECMNLSLALKTLTEFLMLGPSNRRK